MSEISDNDKQSWWQETFQIEMVDPETLQRKPILHIRRWKMIALTIGLILFISLVVYAFIAFTPARRLLPTKYSALDATEIIQLRSKVDEMETILGEQNLYITTLQGLISGRPIDSLQREDTLAVPSTNQTVEPVQKSEEEMELRETLEMEDRLRSLRQTIRLGGNRDVNPGIATKIMAPVIGPVGKGYDPAVSHFGIDILAPKNTAVKSIADGLVLQSDWTVETGNSIMIIHDNGMISVYKHNSSLLKDKYEKVTQGEAVAIVGNTGTLTTGPHVHFELWIDGFPVDPAKYINFQ